MTTVIGPSAPEAGAGMYEAILRRLLADGVMAPDHRVLVQFGGTFDREITERVGLRSCTFANRAPDSPSCGLEDVIQADAHRMAVADGSYDHVIGHAGLHHCSRPHEALHEMYRIAARTVVAVENQDSPLMRLACRCGLAGTYELLAMSDEGGTGGGVDGTDVPNHVYRWTRREVRKTVRTFDPARTVPVEYEAHWFIGPDRALTPRVRALVGQGDTPVRGARALAALALNRALNGLARRQGNIFGFVIRKDLARLQPWIAASPDGSSRSIGSS